MPRPRIHRNDAAKQKAYRERLQLRDTHLRSLLKKLTKLQNHITEDQSKRINQLAARVKALSPKK